MRACRHPITALLPHTPPMLLLDELLRYDESAAIAVTTIRPTSLFREADGVPAHIGLEYMAQTCGAHAGALTLERGEEVKIGLLLGTRQYRAHVPNFRLGERLVIAVTAVYRDAEIGAFDCRIEIAGACAAEAQLTVYQPERPLSPAQEQAR
jgi:predicted hotdog family 3-hydroxylacyl-ACP dehydratase